MRRTRGLTVGVLGQTDSLSDDATVGYSVVGNAPEYEWASDPRIREIISELIADIDWNAKVGTLSGGQRRRVDLTRLLIGDYDVIMMDEPTNHLDIRAIAWLARHLNSRWQRNFRCAFVRHARSLVPRRGMHGHVGSARWQSRAVRGRLFRLCAAAR